MAHEYDAAEVDRQFDWGLKNKASTSGKPARRARSILYDAKQYGYAPPPMDRVSARVEILPFDRLEGLPGFFPNGMDPNVFVGPMVGKAQLFPARAISLLVALGSVGKTSSLIAMAGHISAGRPWGGGSLQQRRGIVFSVEETQQELWRKFSATVVDWPKGDVRRAQDGLLMYSMSERDPRLTRAVNRNIEPTGLAESIIKIATEHEAEFIILDHLQGMVSGDLNNSDTMVAVAHECNRIATVTGAAVVVAAHTSKGNINAEEVNHGFSTGSLAMENAARQVVGLIPMPQKDAKAFGLEAVRTNYIRLEMPKNSYGPGGEVAYLAKHYVPAFHTVTVVPFDPPVVNAGAALTKDERLQRAIVEHVRRHPNTTASSLDKLAGPSGSLKASRKQVRDAVQELTDMGVLKEIDVTKEYRKRYGLMPQVREVYIVKE
ncbi:AAA family ATPase [Roseicyclus sp.]|uniref:AAA family ATPase n=1 Tax=Roseicyclus sp. TaxID=1914329 RepID=UPI001BCF0E93|nr:AAA family ATPase [Roseicyclus sp.]